MMFWQRHYVRLQQHPPSTAEIAGERSGRHEFLNPLCIAPYTLCECDEYHFRRAQNSRNHHTGKRTHLLSRMPQ